MTQEEFSNSTFSKEEIEKIKFLLDELAKEKRERADAYPPYYLRLAGKPSRRHFDNGYLCALSTIRLIVNQKAEEEEEP